MKWCKWCDKLFDASGKWSTVCELCTEKRRMIGGIKSKRTSNVKRIVKRLTTDIHKVYKQE